MWNATHLSVPAVEQNVAAGGEKHMVTDRHTTTSTPNYYSASRGIGADQTNSDWTGLYLARPSRCKTLSVVPTYCSKVACWITGAGRHAPESADAAAGAPPPDCAADQRPSQIGEQRARCRGRPAPWAKAENVGQDRRNAVWPPPWKKAVRFGPTKLSRGDPLWLAVPHVAAAIPVGLVAARIAA